MNSMIDRAKELVKQYKPLLVVAFTSLLLYEIIRDLVQGLPILMILSIGFICISHAEVVFGLKVVKGQLIDPKQDSKVGFSSFKRLFPTYLWLDVIKFILSFILLVGIYVLMGTMGNSYLSSLLDTIEQEASYGIFDSLNQFAIMFTTGVSLVSILTMLLMDCLFLPVPYLLEEGQAKGFKALKQSIALTKGHRLEIFGLCARYTAFSLIFGLLDVMITVMVPGIFISTLLNMFILFGAIRVYRMEYCVTKALLYEKMRGSLYV